jgi:hypothetical protein
MFPLPLHICFEIAAFVASLIFWRALKYSKLAWFIPFLGFVVLAELAGRYLSKELRQPNAWLYNIVIPVEYLFYCLLFHLHYRKKSNKWLSKSFLVLFPAYVLISLFLINNIYYFDTYFLLIGSFFMIVFSIVYLLELYGNPEASAVWKIPMFWVAIGIFIFNAGEFSYNLLSKYFITNRIDPSLKIFRSINNKLILILYSSFIFAFICQKISGKYKRE